MPDHRIMYKNYIVPQEQVTAGKPYYLDSDCGAKLSSSYVLPLGTGGTISAVITATSDVSLGTGFDFIYIRTVDVEGTPAVYLSFNGGSNNHVNLSTKGSSFASKVISSANLRIAISGATVEYFTGIEDPGGLG